HCRASYPNLQGRNEDVPVRSPVWLYLANTAYIRSHVQNILYVADDLPNRLATRYDGALDALRDSSRTYRKVRVHTRWPLAKYWLPLAESHRFQLTPLYYER